MINNFTKTGIKHIFQYLTDDEIMGLAATVTQQLLKNKLNNRSDAEEAILIHSPDFKSILRRKCITKEILFAYAHDNKIPLTAAITKLELIDKILHFWNAGDESHFSTGHQTALQEPNYTQHSSAELVQPSSEDTSVACGSDINALANQFAEWFYSQMNAPNPVGVEHFWNDSVLKLYLHTGSDTVKQEIINNSQELSDLLFRTKTEHCLYFNPNFSLEGVQGKMDPHGLVIVMVCGTLHRNNLCIGIFDQIFGLARDPFSENNWKIKYTYLNLTSKDSVNNMPRLCESKFTSNLLQ